MVNGCDKLQKTRIYPLGEGVAREGCKKFFQDGVREIKNRVELGVAKVSKEGVLGCRKVSRGWSGHGGSVSIRAVEGRRRVRRGWG